MKTYLLLYCCFRLCLCVDIYDEPYELKDQSGESEVMTGTLERSVKTYHCVVNNVKEQQIILYGTKAWTFPIQNVNLTLRYPSTDLDAKKVINKSEYTITGVLVVLHIDGGHSRGYITEGGMLMDQISMTFIIENITRLSYQFWLYGVSTSFINVSEYSWQQNLC